MFEKNINFFWCSRQRTLQFCNQLLKTKKSKILLRLMKVLQFPWCRHFLATKRICIYLQNSGIGNATDPITNL